MTDIILLTLAILFIILAINKMKNALIEKDNHFAQMQRYLDDCEKEKHKNDFMDYINEIETYDKIMNNKTYR